MADLGLLGCVMTTLGTGRRAVSSSISAHHVDLPGSRGGTHPGESTGTSWNAAPSVTTKPLRQYGTESRRPACQRAQLQQPQAQIQGLEDSALLGWRGSQSCSKGRRFPTRLQIAGSGGTKPTPSRPEVPPIWPARRCQTWAGNPAGVERCFEMPQLILEHLACGTKVKTWRWITHPQRIQFRCPLCEENIAVNVSAEALARDYADSAVENALD